MTITTTCFSNNNVPETVPKELRDMMKENIDNNKDNLVSYTLPSSRLAETQDCENLENQQYVTFADNLDYICRHCWSYLKTTLLLII